MLIALLAVALQTTTTNCQPFGGTVTCQGQTYQQPDFSAHIPDYGSVVRSGQQSVPTYQPSPPVPSRRNGGLRAEVARLIGGGDCQGGVDWALRHGDMDLAREAKDFCAK